MKQAKTARRIKKSREDKIFDGIVYTIIIILMIIVLYPLYFVVIASISDPNAVNLGEVMFWPKGLSLEGYETLLQNEELWIGYRNTVLYTVCGVGTCLLVNIPAGFALSRKNIYGGKLIRAYYMIPMFFGGGLIPTYINIRNFGLYDTIWVMFVPFAVSIYYIIVSRTYFRTSIPEELWDSARIDGAGTLGYFFKIVLPLAKPIIAVIALWFAVQQWNSYFGALIYLNDRDLQPLQLFIRRILIQNQTASSMLSGTAAAEARRLSELIKYTTIIVGSLPVMCLYPFVQKYFNKGIMVGSLKG